MPGTDLIRPIRSTFWDLRAHWASGKRVAISLAGGRRVEGHVTAVSATDAFVQVGGTRFYPDEILAVHSPSRLGDATGRSDDRWHGAPRRWRPQVEEIPGVNA